MIIDVLEIIFDSYVTRTDLRLLSPRFSEYTVEYIRKMVFSRTKQLHDLLNIAMYSG